MKTALTIYLVTLLVLAGGTVYRAQTTGEPSAVLLKAHVVQLEGQLQESRGLLAVCSANLAISQQPQAIKARDDARVAIEREAGCVIDWTASPPVCVPTPLSTDAVPLTKDPR